LAQKRKASSFGWGPFYAQKIFWHRAIVEMPPKGPNLGEINELLPHYITTTDTPAAAIPASLTVGCGRSERNQPAESHARGITNSDQPQSRQTRISGEGVIGG
jgi:hypothetical protein